MKTQTLGEPLNKLDCRWNGLWNDEIAGQARNDGWAQNDAFTENSEFRK